MSRYIDADKLVELCDEMSRNEWNKKVSPISWADAYESFVDDIDEIPTADVVEVVRCKDCVYSSCYGQICHYSVGRDVQPEHYCSYGERREENEG